MRLVASPASLAVSNNPWCVNHHAFGRACLPTSLAFIMMPGLAERMLNIKCAAS